MRKNIYLTFSTYLFFTIQVVWAQDTITNSSYGVSTFKMFREPSYILLGSGIGNLEPLIFEGDVVPYFMLSVSQTAKWGIELSPHILVRMYNKYSYPIRSPSFMPRITIFYQFIDNDDKKRDLFSYFSWFHHSNGQDGNFYNTNGTINTISGSFSTNWIEGGVFLSRPDPILPINTNYFKLFSTYNYQQQPELDGIYGRLRFFFDYQSSINFTKAILKRRLMDNNRNFILNQSIRVGWIAGNISDIKDIAKKRFIFKYTLTFKPYFLNDVAIFCQYYYGQDYYNIYFNRTLNVFRIGIASKVSVFN